MENYIDGFLFPLQRAHLNDYKAISNAVADIWKEYGALAYYEYLGDDLKLEGTRSFIEALNLKENEVVIFGWVVFPSKEIRELANEQLPKDPRMTELIAPLTNPDRLIFDASRMFYGGFQHLVSTN